MGIDFVALQEKIDSGEVPSIAEHFPSLIVMGTGLGNCPFILVIPGGWSDPTTAWIDCWPLFSGLFAPTGISKPKNRPQIDLKKTLPARTS